MHFGEVTVLLLQIAHPILGTTQFTHSAQGAKQ
jgi:hypothetical protein